MTESYTRPASPLPVDLENQLRDALAAKNATLISACNDPAERRIDTEVQWDYDTAEGYAFFKKLREEWEYMTKNPSCYQNGRFDRYSRRYGAHLVVELTGSAYDDRFLAFAADHMTWATATIGGEAVRVLTETARTAGDERANWTNFWTVAVTIHPADLLTMLKLLQLEQHQATRRYEASI